MKIVGWGHREWRRAGMVMVLSTAAALGASCSTETKPRGQIMLALSTDMSIVKDMDEIVVDVFPETGSGQSFYYDLQGKNSDGTLVEGTGLKPMPGTIAIVPPNSGGQLVRIRVTAKSTLDGANTPRVVREAIAKVPEDRVALLEMPLRWLCSGKDASGRDQVAKDGQSSYQSQCYLDSKDQTNHMTCGGGDCVSADIDTNALPDYTPQQVFGGGDQKGNGSSCLDVPGCFGTEPTTDLDRSDCSVPVPSDADPKVLNVAMVLPPNSDGHCLDTSAGPGTGKCYLPLDVENGHAPADGGTSTSSVHEGFFVSGGKIYLPKAVCNRQLVQGVAVSQSSSCILSRTGHVTSKSKDLSIPVCGPWTGWPEALPPPLPDGGPGPDASIGGRGEGGTTGSSGGAPGAGGTLDGGPMPGDAGEQLCTSTAARAPAYYYVFLDRTASVGQPVLPLTAALASFSSDQKSAGINFGLQLSSDSRQSMSVQEECSSNYSTPALPFTPLPLGNGKLPVIQPSSFTNLLLDSAMGQSLEALEAPAAPASRTLVVITAAHDDPQAGCGTTTDLMKQTVSKALADGVSLRPIVIAGQADPPNLTQGFQVANAPQPVQMSATNVQPATIVQELDNYRDEIARCTYVAPATRGNVKYTVQLASADTTTPLVEVPNASACSTTDGSEQYYQPTSSTFVLCPIACAALGSADVESVVPLAAVADPASCNSNNGAGGAPGTAGAANAGGAPSSGTGGVPSTCTTAADCGAQTPFCDTSTGRCVQCLGDANCNGQTCNLTTHTCARATSGLSACITNPAQQVALLGDAFVIGSNSPPLQQALSSQVKTAAQYANLGAVGAAMASGGMGSLIPTQLQQALAMHPQLKLLIMDGGGGDLFTCDATQHPNCATDCGATGATQHQECTDIVSAAVSRFNQMLSTAANAGVKDVVYFSYPHVPVNNGGYDEILDSANSLFQQACAGALQTNGGKLACHFVDLVQPFQVSGDRNPTNFATPISPSAAGETIIATQIANTMQSACLGQSTGCCSP